MARMFSGVKAPLPASLRTPSVPNNFCDGAAGCLVALAAGFLLGFLTDFPRVLLAGAFADFAAFLEAFFAGFFVDLVDLADLRGAGLRADAFDCFCLRFATTVPRPVWAASLRVHTGAVKLWAQCPELAPAR